MRIADVPHKVERTCTYCRQAARSCSYHESSSTCIIKRHSFSQAKHQTENRISYSCSDHSACKNDHPSMVVHMPHLPQKRSIGIIAPSLVFYNTQGIQHNSYCHTSS